MPKGIPNKTETAVATDAPRKLTITVRAADYDALVQFAAEQYRTPELQAAWLIARVLNEAGRGPGATPSPLAARILDHAAKTNGN